MASHVPAGSRGMRGQHMKPFRSWLRSLSVIMAILGSSGCAETISHLPIDVRPEPFTVLRQGPLIDSALVRVDVPAPIVIGANIGNDVEIASQALRNAIETVIGAASIFGRDPSNPVQIEA